MMPRRSNALIVLQLHRIEHRARRNARVADPPHRLMLGVLPGPGGDDLIDLGLARDAIGRREVALVADQILAPDQFQQAGPNGPDWRGWS